jgi:Ferredoxin-dependent bilin reductase
MEQALNLRKYFDLVTQEFTSAFGYPDRPELDNPNGTWINNIYKSPIFRHIHLEYYQTKRISVFHANIFPNATVDYPILGVDFIEIGNKITGFFFDVTPINANQIVQKSLIKFKSIITSPERKLPEWANFFSENFICITPNEEELLLLFTHSLAIIREYLDYSKTYKEKYNLNIQKQNAYCIGQKKNEKTFKALAADIGEDKAKKFLNNFMFPEL